MARTRCTIQLECAPNGSDGDVARCLEHLRIAGCVRVSVNGSYVTDKDQPGDVDVLYDAWGIRPKDLHPLFRTESSDKRRERRKRFGGDYFAVFDDELDGALIGHFQTDRSRSQRNEHERLVTVRKLAELSTALEVRLAAPLPARRDPEMQQLVNDGLRAQVDELSAELDDYAALNKGSIRVTVPPLDELAEQLIRARIAAGLSQRQLASAAGLAEGVIRRYERERYAHTSLEKLQHIWVVLRECTPNPPQARANNQVVRPVPTRT